MHTIGRILELPMKKLSTQSQFQYTFNMSTLDLNSPLHSNSHVVASISF